MKILLIIIIILLAIGIGIYAFNSYQERMRKIKADCMEEARYEVEKYWKSLKPGEEIKLGESPTKTSVYKRCLERYKME